MQQTPQASPPVPPASYQAPAPEQPIAPQPATPADATLDTAPVETQQAPTTQDTPELPADETNEQADVSDAAPDDDEAVIRWQAAEYIHHERSSLWFVGLAIVAIVLMGIAAFLMRSITFAVLIPVMAVTLILYVKRPPNTINYTLSRQGLHVNDKLYLYDQFKSFGLATHSDHHAVVLVPRKRFQVSQTVYFPEEVGEPLVDMLATRLPMVEHQPDAIDKLLTRLRL